MALTQTQVSQLYVSAFGRASEGEGNTFWQTNGGATMADVADSMLATDAAKTYFGSALDTDQAFIEYIYTNTLGKDPATDTDGVSYWVGRLTDGDSRGTVISTMIDAVVGGDFSGDAAALAAQNQFNNRVTVSNYCADNINSASADDLAAFQGYISNVDDTAATVTSSQLSIDEAAALANIDGETTVLTTSDDTVIGTAKNDLIDGSTSNTLTNGDVILDSTTTDADVLQATVNSSGLTSRIQNIETLNITGAYVTTGLALTNVSGATTLNLDTDLAGGTATVTDANSLNAANINAKTNISKIDVTSLSSGTRDAVNVNAGSATTVNITGSATGADTYTVTVAKSANVTLATVGANDDVSITAAGDFDLTSVAALADLTITANSEATEVTLSGGVAEDTVIAGSQNVTIKSTSALLNGLGVTKTSTGTVTLELGAVTNDDMLNEVVVDTVEFTDTTGVNNDTVTVNNNSTVDLKKDLQGGGDTVNIDIDNATTDLDFASGTLLLNVSESQTATIAIGDDTAARTNAGVVVLNATPDETTDTDSDENGVAETQITLAGLDLDTNGNEASTLIVQGSADLSITLLTNVAAGVVSASSMTGDLTIGDTTDAGTFVLGSGDDTISDTADGAVATISAGAGDDTITVGTGNNVIKGEAGNDTITGNSGTDTIDGGTGNDTINGGAGADTITTGTGSDTVIMASGEAGDTITDFAKGADTLVLTGAGEGINLSALSAPTAGAYTNLDGTANFDITLTGLSATDLSDSIQLGNAAAAYDITALSDFSAAAAAATIVAGDKDDVIQAGGVVSDSSTDADDVAQSITLGDGADTLILQNTSIADGTAVDTATITVTDFVSGTDKIVFTGTAAGAVDLSSAVTPTAGVYDIDGAGTFDVTLQNGGSALTATDVSSMFQLGASATAAFDVNGNNVTGSTFDDFLSNGGGAAVFSFIDNNGMDTIAGFTTGTDDLSFDGITGITATAGVDLSSSTSKVTDATDGAVYVFGNATSAHAGSAKVSSFTVATANGVTADTILADVADFLEANLGEADGENYVAVMNDGTNSYAYLVAADSDGIDADDITLIGTLTGAIAANGDIA